MTRTEFEAAYKRLIEGLEARRDNVRCIECVGCERCTDSTFCRSSKGLAGCHYCVDCERCSSSTHCRGSRDLLRCNHCVASERCSHSSYLVRSVDCHGCSYCFGCVGLTNKDFHVLNEPYDRSAYFALTSRLARELKL
jgi:hypothetical protein